MTTPACTTPSSSCIAARTGRVAVIIASGEILDGQQPPGVVGGISTANLLREAREDEDIAAVVLRVDSPGGSVYWRPSRSIARWPPSRPPASRSSSPWATWPLPAATTWPRRPNEIFASPTTITGSIGIYAALPTFDRTLGKVGVTVDGVGTTALSGKLRVDRPLDPVLRDYVQLSISSAATSSSSGMWPRARQDDPRAGEDAGVGVACGSAARPGPAAWSIRWAASTMR